MTPADQHGTGLLPVLPLALGTASRLERRRARVENLALFEGRADALHVQRMRDMDQVEERRREQEEREMRHRAERKRRDEESAADTKRKHELRQLQHDKAIADLAHAKKRMAIALGLAATLIAAIIAGSEGGVRGVLAQLGLTPQQTGAAPSVSAVRKALSRLLGIDQADAALVSSIDAGMDDLQDAQGENIDGWEAMLRRLDPMVTIPRGTP